MKRYIALAIVGLYSIGISRVQAETWQQSVENGMKWSSAEHGGRPDVRRACYPNTQTCETAIVYHNVHDHSIIELKTVSDINGQDLSHQTCLYNVTQDIESCYDLEHWIGYRFMKDTAGNWTTVYAGPLNNPGQRTQPQRGDCAKGIELLGNDYINDYQKAAVLEGLKNSGCLGGK